MCLLECIFISFKPENLVSTIQLLKLLLISFNAERLRSASVDVASRVHPNTSKILMFEKIFASADANDLIKVAGKSSSLSDCLDYILKHLDTSLSNDLGVTRSWCHDSNCSGEA